MLSNEFAETRTLLSDDHDTHFTSARWLAYFEENRRAQINIHFPDIAIPTDLRTPLIRSLQRFQLGETGDGRFLRKYAKSLNDPDYERCIDMFIKEEQFHASVLARMIAAMDGTLLSWHWTDLAFIALRRMLGLKTELFILLIAEVIGKCFYRRCAKGVSDRLLSDAFSLISLDEIGHLEFHCAFLAERFKRAPVLFRYSIWWAWSSIFYAACLVFVADHFRTIYALNLKPSEFVQDCCNTFHRSATRALLL